MGREYKFINPYNFIPLGDKCIRKQPNTNEKRYTGSIDCELKTLTPLIMIDSNQYTEHNEHKTYSDTYILDDTPAIPGSELRGMIRAKFETLTQSCLNSYDPGLSFYGRYNGNMRSPGLLDFSDKQHPKLYSCDKYEINYNEVKHLKTGDLVSFDIDEFYKKMKNGKNKKSWRAKISKNGKHEGYLKIGEEIQKKHHCHVFMMNECIAEDIGFISTYKELAELCKDNLELYRKKERDSKDGKDHLSYTDKDIKPVWYEKLDGYIYFSLSQNGQTKYRHKGEDVIDDDFLPCLDKDNLCEACQVFGTVQDDLAVASKVRFSDAYLTNNLKDYRKYKQPIVLSELASPRYNNALFYMLLKDNGNFVKNKTEFNWNVDFKSKFSMNENEPLDLKDGDVLIRGRKEYWHHKPANKIEEEKTNRNISVNPVKEGCIYKFKVYFDKLTKEQLEHLNMSINLINDSSLAHKLGHGKPLGYGSIKIKTSNIVYKEMTIENNKVHYQIKQYNPTVKTIQELTQLMTNEQKKAINHMYDYNFLLDKDIIVDYPRNEKDGKVFEWFMENSRHKKGVLPFSDCEYDRIVQSGYNKEK